MEKPKKKVTKAQKKEASKGDTKPVADNPERPGGTKGYTYIDWHKFDELLRHGANLVDSAYFLKVSTRTVIRAIRREKGMTFHEYANLNMGPTRMQLKQMMLKKALTDGNFKALQFCMENICDWGRNYNHNFTSMPTEELEDLNEALQKEIDEQDSDPGDEGE